MTIDISAFSASILIETTLCIYFKQNCREKIDLMYINILIIEKDLLPITIVTMHSKYFSHCVTEIFSCCHWDRNWVIIVTERRERVVRDED